MIATLYFFHFMQNKTDLIKPEGEEAEAIRFLIVLSFHIFTISS
jgi:hypothetical protein